MKILFLDIETAPNVAHVWGLWQQNVGLPQIIDSGYVLSCAAKWADEETINFYSVFHDGPKMMLRRIHQMLDVADAVVHYNGTKFDIPTLNKEFILQGLGPPAPYKQIDLLKTARSQFKFASNKLTYICDALGLGKKYEHEGHQLWIRCMNADPIAWETMKQYNMHDVRLLEKLYLKLLPWIPNHLNYSVLEEGLMCPNCGGIHYQKRGFSITRSCKYQRYQCLNCGTWFRDTKNIGPKAGEKFVNV